MECCGWIHPTNWSDNLVIKNSSRNLYSCSCRNSSLPGSEIQLVGLCEDLSSDLPIFETVHTNIFYSSKAVNAHGRIQHPSRETTRNGGLDVLLLRRSFGMKCQQPQTHVDFEKRAETNLSSQYYYDWICSNSEAAYRSKNHCASKLMKKLIY